MSKPKEIQEKSHRSEVLFPRKFIPAYQKHKLHALRGEEKDEAFKMFVVEMQTLGEYKVST